VLRHSSNVLQYGSLTPMVVRPVAAAAKGPARGSNSSRCCRIIVSCKGLVPEASEALLECQLVPVTYCHTVACSTAAMQHIP
jgi:hypothetical protein